MKEENGLNGCMVGRATHENPWIMGDFDKVVYGVPNPGLSRKEVILRYAEYLGKAKQGGHCNRVMINPIISLLHGEKDEEIYYNFLSEGERTEKYSNDLQKLLEDSVDRKSVV